MSWYNDLMKPSSGGSGLHEKLDELLKVSKKNNRMLHAMRRDAWIGFFLKLLFWVIIIGGPIVLYYYYLAPYVDQFREAYSGVQDGVNSIEESANRLPQLPDLGGLFDFFGSSQ